MVKGDSISTDATNLHHLQENKVDFHRHVRKLTFSGKQIQFAQSLRNFRKSQTQLETLTLGPKIIL